MKTQYLDDFDFPNSKDSHVAQPQAGTSGVSLAIPASLTAVSCSNKSGPDDKAIAPTISALNALVSHCGATLPTTGQDGVSSPGAT